MHCRRSALSPCLRDRAHARDTPGETSQTWAICLAKDAGSGAHADADADADPALHRTASNAIPADAGGHAGRERRPSTATASAVIPAGAGGTLGAAPHRPPGPDRIFAHAHSSVRIYAHIDEEEGSKCVML